MANKILIIGAKGLLGTALSRMVPGKFEVYLADLPGSFDYTEGKKRERIVEFDIKEESKTIEVIKDIGPDFVIHLAGNTDVDGCEINKEEAFKVNADGAQHIALGCKKTDSFLFYISTDFVFDGNKVSPYNEKDEPSPINVYGLSKLEGERCIQRLLKRFCIIRTSWLFGHDGPNFIDAVLDKVSIKNSIEVVSDQIGSPTYAKDLSDALIGLLKLSANKSLPSILHVTNSENTTWDNLAREVLICAKIKGVNVIPISSSELDRPAKRPKMSILDNNLYNNISGTSMRSYRDALKEYICTRVITNKTTRR